MKLATAIIFLGINTVINAGPMVFQLLQTLFQSVKRTLSYLKNCHPVRHPVTWSTAWQKVFYSLEGVSRCWIDGAEAMKAVKDSSLGLSAHFELQPWAIWTHGLGARWPFTGSLGPSGPERPRKCLKKVSQGRRAPPESLEKVSKKSFRDLFETFSRLFPDSPGPCESLFPDFFQTLRGPGAGGPRRLFFRLFRGLSERPCKWPTGSQLMATNPFAQPPLRGDADLWSFCSHFGTKIAALAIVSPRKSIATCGDWRSSAPSGSEKGVFWKRRLFRKVHLLEHLESLEILENPQTGENKGE